MHDTPLRGKDRRAPARPHWLALAGSGGYKGRRAGVPAQSLIRKGHVMGTYYAAIEAFDPEGPELAGADGPYGGEARFLVLQAEDLIEALAMLADSAAANGLVLTRVLHAGRIEDFDDDMLPFEVDIDGMAETAAQSGDICVSEAFVFEPDAAEPAPGGVYACCVDAFDPDWAEEDEADYAGHFQLAVIRAESATAALTGVIAAFAEDGIEMLALEGLVDAAAFPFDAYEFAFDAEAAIADVTEEGGMILSDAYSYGPEPEDMVRRLDS